MLWRKIEPVGLVTRTISLIHCRHQSKYSCRARLSFVLLYFFFRLKGGSEKVMSTLLSGISLNSVKQSPSMILFKYLSIMRYLKEPGPSDMTQLLIEKCF